MALVSHKSSESHKTSISTGEYPVSRPLFFYVKKAHIGVILGLKDFAEFFVLDEIAGEDGPLSEYGLVADPELEVTQETIADEKTIADRCWAVSL